MSSKLQSDGCCYYSVVAPSGERLPGEGRHDDLAIGLCKTGRTQTHSFIHVFAV